MTLVIAALLALAGCRVQPGAAAFVGDQRISEGAVEALVTSSVPATSSSTPGQLPPRAQVVSTLVGTQVLRDYLSVTDGGLPSQAELAANRDQAFNTVTGSAIPDLGTLTTAVEKLGFDATFVGAYIDQVEVEYVVIQRTKATSLAELGKAVTARTPAVRISPRYGAWDPSQLALSGAATPPAYLTLTSSSTA